MHAIAALIRNDLRLYFASRRALLMNIVAPIVIAAFFGSLFDSGASKGPMRIPVALVDLDASPISGQIVEDMRGDTAFDIQPLDAAAALARVREGKVRAAITFPKGFGDAVLGAIFRPGDRPSISVQYDPSQAMTLAVVRGLLTQHVMQGLIQSALRGNAGQTLLDQAHKQVAASTGLSAERKRNLQAVLDDVDRQRQAAGGTVVAPSAPLKLELPFATSEQEVTASGEHAYNSYAHAFAGMGVQFILFMGVDLGVALLLARRMGLWKRLRAAPLSRAALLAARMASSALIALILLLIIYAAAMLLFDVRIEGSRAGFAGVALSFAFLTASFGLLVAALGKTPEATRGLAIFLTLLLVMLSGAWVPSFVFPQWLQTVSLFAPTRWAVDGLDAMTWRGLGFSAALGPMAAMLGFGLVFAALAVWRFDWDE